MKTFHILRISFPKIHFNIIFTPMPKSSERSLPFRPSGKMHYIKYFSILYSGSHCIYTGYNLKRNPTTIMCSSINIRSEADPCPYNRLESRSPSLLGCCSRHLCKSSAGAKMVCSRPEHVFILKHCFTSKSPADVREAFSK
jgi:hypothetical protein